MREAVAARCNSGLPPGRRLKGRSRAQGGSPPLPVHMASATCGPGRGLHLSRACVSEPPGPRAGDQPARPLPPRFAREGGPATDGLSQGRCQEPETDFFGARDCLRIGTSTANNVGPLQGFSRSASESDDMLLRRHSPREQRPRRPKEYRAGRREGDHHRASDSHSDRQSRGWKTQPLKGGRPVHDDRRSHAAPRIEALYACVHVATVTGCRTGSRSASLTTRASGSRSRVARADR